MAVGTKRNQVWGILALLVAAVIWGFSFSAQKMGMEHVGPCAFNTLRSFIGSLALMPCIALLDMLNHHRPSVWGNAKSGGERRDLLLGGVVCGSCLGLASILQQVGLQYTTPAKAGFLTALYIIIVPLLGMAFLGHRIHRGIWGAVALALLGMALLCGISWRSGFAAGDLWELGCAFAFALQILAIAHFVHRVDCVRLSCLQFLVAGLISFPVALIAGEHFSCSSILAAFWPLMVCGVLSSGIAYTFQIVGEKYVAPVIATLLMSLESVFSAVGGWLFLGQRLTLRELIGCAAILSAVLLAQLLPAKTH